MKSYLWVDSETTGLKPMQHDIVQLAFIPVVNGVPQEPFNEFCQPRDYSSIESEAVAIHGITPERMRTFQTPEQLMAKLIARLKPCGKKFVLAGYNVNFDKGFLGSFFAKQGMSAAYSELFSHEIHDVLVRARSVKDQLKTTSLKLEALAKEFGIEISAHDALSDIAATMEVDKTISKLLGDDDIEQIFEDQIEDITFPEPAYLHLHSEFSNTDSVLSVENWIRWAVKTGVKSIAFPDHGLAASLYKSINTPKLIAEINKEDKTKIAPDAVSIVPAISINVSMPGVEGHFRLNAWAQSNVGYRNLLKLSSLGWESNVEDGGVHIAVVPLDDVARHVDGVAFGSGCERGPLGHFSLSCSVEQVKSYAAKLQVALGKRLTYEMLAMDVVKTFVPKLGFRGIKKTETIVDGNIAATVNRIIKEIVEETGAKFIVSTAAHYVDPDDKVLQDVVSKSSFKDGRCYFESRHHRSTSECFAIIKRHLGDWFTPAKMLEAIENSHAIASEASAIDIKHEYHLPRIPIPDAIVNKTSNYDQQLYYVLMSKIKEHGRWRDDKVYVDRFKREYDVIAKNAKLNFLPYFLVYEDICRFARESGILQNIARGSAGGCLVSYYLKIIHIDPIVENLPFERFLSHARINGGSFPDIDADFGVREPIVKYLREKYGMGFAQIGTFQRFKTKNAIKDTMFAVFGRNRADRELMDVCDSIPDSPQGLDEKDFLYGYTDAEGIEHKGNLEQNPTLQLFFQQYPEIEQIVKHLIGLPKEFGRHPSAFVISTLDLASDRLPIRIMHDQKLGAIPVAQYDAEMVEKSGLVKADVLVVTTIETVAECIKLIKARTGLDLLEENERGVQALYRLPEDSDVYADFYRRRTDSSFQFNTDLIKGYIQDFSPTCRKDLSDLTALCRPGTLDAPLYDTTATDYYISVRKGERTVEYLHEDLRPILEPHNGVFVYQESIMRFLAEVVGYTWEKADTIRSAIAKKKREVIVATFDDIRKVCSSRGWTGEAIESVCQQILAFSNYSFNLSHSRAYSELGYITMWLKHHYLLEWWTAELNLSSEAKLRKYVNVLGPLITPPSLLSPSDGFTIVGDKIAAPLWAVKGLGPATIKEISANGPYSSLRDFLSRCGKKVNAGHFAALVKSRAMDCLMDPSLQYGLAKGNLLKEYLDIKKVKKLADDVCTVDPLEVFLVERETLKTFNKVISHDSAVRELLRKRWPALVETGKRDVPMMMGQGDKAVPVIESVQAAAKLLALHGDDCEMEVGMVGLFQSSSYKEGRSKRTGRPWKKVDVIVSDGMANMECTWWDAKKALGIPANTIVYLRGLLKRDWKGKPSLSLYEVVRDGEYD